MTGAAPVPGTAAHASRDENHVCAFKKLGQVVGRFFRRLAADLRVTRRTQAPRQLFADTDPGDGLGEQQCLYVRVDGDEIHALNTILDHAIDRVAATSAYADNLDTGRSI